MTQRGVVEKHVQHRLDSRRVDVFAPTRPEGGDGDDDVPFIQRRPRDDHLLRQPSTLGTLGIIREEVFRAVMTPVQRQERPFRFRRLQLAVFIRRRRTFPNRLHLLLSDQSALRIPPSTDVRH